MKKKSSVLKIAASVLSLCFYLFMATGSDESSSDSQGNEEHEEEEYEEHEEEEYEEPVPSKPIEREPVFSNDELEEEQDTVLMRDTYDNDDILEE